MNSFTSNAAASAPRSLKSRLQSGETLYGIFLFSNSPTIAEIAGLSGYDFVVVDLEHGPGLISDALPCLHAIAATGTPAVIRVPKCDATWAKKALDIGPQGIMFPMIEDAETARQAVSYCMFPPKGIRGSAHTLVRASGYGTNPNYLRDYESNLLLMCQVESEEGVKNIEEIAAVDGVDVVQMGPRDLSASMGYLQDPGNARVKEVLHGAERAVLKGGAAYLSGIVTAHDPAVGMRRRGYHMVAGPDVGLFRDAAMEEVRRFQMSPTPAVVEEDVKGIKTSSNGHAIAAEEDVRRFKNTNSNGTAVAEKDVRRFKINGTTTAAAATAVAAAVAEEDVGRFDMSAIAAEEDLRRFDMSSLAAAVAEEDVRRFKINTTTAAVAELKI